MRGGVVVSVGKVQSTTLVTSHCCQHRTVGSNNKLKTSALHSTTVLLEKRMVFTKIKFNKSCLLKNPRVNTSVVYLVMFLCTCHAVLIYILVTYGIIEDLKQYC